MRAKPGWPRCRKLVYCRSVIKPIYAWRNLHRNLRIEKSLATEITEYTEDDTIILISVFSVFSVHSVAEVNTSNV